MGQCCNYILLINKAYLDPFYYSSPYHSMFQNSSIITLCMLLPLIPGFEHTTIATSYMPVIIHFRYFLPQQAGNYFLIYVIKHIVSVHTYLI